MHQFCITQRAQGQGQGLRGLPGLEAGAPGDPERRVRVLWGWGRIFPAAQRAPRASPAYLSTSGRQMIGKAEVPIGESLPQSRRPRNPPAAGPSQTKPLESSPRDPAIRDPRDSPGPTAQASKPRPGPARSCARSPAQAPPPTVTGGRSGQ